MPPPEAAPVPSALKPLLHVIGKQADAWRLSAYAVGGCVRDWLLSARQTPDLDISVAGDALLLARKVAGCFSGKLIEHRQFGTATLELKGAGHRRIDFSGCRKEVYSRPAAYPKVSAGSLKEDLFRRDFSINAMAVVINSAGFGKLLDPFNGKKDLAAGMLRVLHARSFSDDPSRILRGVRFLARFGLHWDAKTYTLAVRAIAEGMLGELNVGRLGRELEHMIDEPKPRRCFDALAGLLAAAQKAS